LLNVDPEITLASTNCSISLFARVEFGFEIIGEVDELLDLSLNEQHEALRQTFEVELENLELADALALSNFCYDTDKLLTIDGVGYGVVNDSGNYKKTVEFWKKSNKRGTLTLKFRRKLTGIDVAENFVTEETEDEFVTEDNVVIKTE